MNTNENNSSISFKWHDIEEGNKLIQEALEQSLIKVKKTLIDYLNSVISFIEMKDKRRPSYNLDAAISSFQNLIIDLQNTAFIADALNDNSSLPYVSDLKNELQKSLDTISSYIDIYSSTDTSSSQLLELLGTIESANPNEWIDYNLSLAISNSKNNLIMNVFVATCLGLIVSIIYILLLGFFKRFQKSLID